MKNCPDDVGLEIFRLSPTAPVREHIAQCDTCLRRLAQMERVERDFKQFVFPRTVDQLVRTANARRGFLPFIALVPIAVAAALFFATLQRIPLKPEANYIGIKGGAVGLSVFALENDTAPRRVANNARINAQAQIRFSVKPSQPCWLWIVSVDNTGQISRLFPIEGNAIQVQGETTLPGGAQLDGATGLERFIGVCTTEPMPYDVLAALVRKQASQGLSRIEGLSDNAFQETLLIEKTQ